MNKDIHFPPFYATISFLNGSQQGCLQVEVKPQIIVYQIERNTISTVENDTNLKNAGIYLLVNDKKHTVYVGQAVKRMNGEGLLARIREPHASPDIDDWQYAYALTSNTEYFLGDSELCYLEQFFYDKAVNSVHYKLLNSKRPTSSGVSQHIAMSLNNYAMYAFFLLENLLKCRIFEPMFHKKPEPDKHLDSGDSTYEVGSDTEKSKNKKAQLSHEVVGKTFYLKNVSKNVNATGVMSNTKSITVRAGATVCQNNSLPNQKGQEHAAAKRQELIDNAVIVNFTFAKDYQFSSTTIAASVLLGQSANGITAWKDEMGKELKSYALKL